MVQKIRTPFDRAVERGGPFARALPFVNKQPRRASGYCGEARRRARRISGEFVYNKLRACSEQHHPPPIQHFPHNQRAPDLTLRWAAYTQDVAGMEPLVLFDDTESVVSNEQPSSSRIYGRITFSLGNGHLDRNGRVDADYSGKREPSSRRPEVGVASSEKNRHHHSQPWQQLPYDRHSVHVVTQYYVPGDQQRAREVIWCGQHCFFSCDASVNIYKNCRVAWFCRGRRRILQQWVNI